MRHPCLYLAGAFSLGCAIGAGIGLVPAILVLGLAAGSAMLALRAAPRAAWPAVLAAAAATGAAASSGERLSYESASRSVWATESGEGPALLEGLAAQDLAVIEGRGRLLLELDAVTRAGRRRALRGRARISIGGELAQPGVLEGQRVRLWTTLHPPRGYGTPGARDLPAEARRNGILGFGHCKSPRLVEWDEGGASAFARARRSARTSLARYVSGDQELAVARAMLLGDRGGFESETLEAFRASGTYHVLALSGAQVALLAGLLGVVLRRLRVPAWLRATALVTIMASYAIFVGAEAPVVRAALMAGCLVIGQAIELEAEAANALGLAACVLLLFRPGDVADPGFQLSFLGTLGLLLLAPRIRELLPELPWRLEWALAASLGAQLALAPLLVGHFHRLAPAALLLNVVAVPLATLVLVSAALLSVTVVWLPALGPFWGWVTETAAHGLLWAGGSIAPGGALDARVPDPPLVFWSPFVLGVIALLRGRGLAGLTAACLGVALVAWVRGPGPRDGSLEIQFLDVGQGDAIVLRSPGGRHALVDAGGSFDNRFDVGENVVAPFLWRRGVARLDWILVTHAHPDHVGGVRSLLRSFGVSRFIEGPAPLRDRGYAQLTADLRGVATSRTSVVAGARWEWDGVEIEVIGPAAPRFAPATTRNDDSLVLRVRFGAFSALLTGDVEQAGEQALGGSPVTLLKVAHHGSQTSSSRAFLAQLRPPLAVICVGDRNPFGHPRQEVIGRLHQVGARVFRTDRDGAVRVVTDGRMTTVTSWRSRRDESVSPVRDLQGKGVVLPSPSADDNRRPLAYRDEPRSPGFQSY